MIKHELKRLIEQAVAGSSAAGDLPPLPPPEVTLERAAKPELGDYATNVALRLQRAAGMPPLDVAGAIARHFEQPPSVARVEVARPGFINLFLADEWLQQQVDTILQAGPRFGAVPLGGRRRVQVEFVSGNPTGPLHVGAARNAALGDTLCNVLALTDHQVEREYYVNDAGSRIAALGASVWARYRQLHGIDAELPAEGYEGDYVLELARCVADEHGRALLELSDDDAAERIGRLAEPIVMAWIERDLADLGVHFDRWFSEQSLFEKGQVDEVLRLLRERGHVTERDGAVWFASSELGEERDNVLIRSNGQPTYFASDVAYHYDKLVRRGFDRAINVWAADHHGHVARMKAVVQALGIEPERLVVLLYQLVKLFEQGQELKMSKRAGTYVTVRELIDKVGADAARFWLLSRSADVQMNFNLDLARESSKENPVYYVQYAHARTAGILRNAGAIDYLGGDVGRLQAQPELTLIRKLLQFPEIVESASVGLAPHELTFYVRDLADVFTAFYEVCRVLPGPDHPLEAALTRARLKLVAATQTVLANALRLLGVSAPDRMEAGAQP